MPIYRRLATAWFFASFFALLGGQSWATPNVLFTTANLGGGFFQYDLTVDNRGGSEPFSGLLVINGNSVFGLFDTSVIGAPQDIGGNALADWSFFAPIPPFFDILFYFSLDAAADVPIGGSLRGFFFRSIKDPSTIHGDEFAVEAIGANSASEIPLGNARSVPEPSTLVLLIVGLAGWIGWSAFGNRNRANAHGI